MVLTSDGRNWSLGQRVNEIAADILMQLTISK